MVVAHGIKIGRNNSDSATEAMMDSARVGLDYIVENADYVEKLASALESKNFVVKKQVFELLSALAVYSNEGYARTLQALDYFKSHRAERYRFKFIVQELRSSPTVEYQTAILAFVNCLILATPDLRERIRVRSEFIGLKLLQALSDLRSKHKDFPDLLVQLDVFDEQKESDEGQIVPNSCGIDLSSPLEVFDAILRPIADSPLEGPFLCLLQHLLRIEAKEPISDLIWDAAEKLVHRATLVESSEDALRLLKTPSHSKSLQKLKANAEKCNNCGCHKSERPDVTTEIPAVAPPPPPVPPPPPPIMGGAPPPPPPPGGIPPFKKDVPKLPQQSIPIPKAKMRTVNWNKIPSGQVLSGDNLWATIAKKQNSKVSLDWNTLEGLFCLQTEKQAVNGGNNLGVPRTPSGEGDTERRTVRREASEVTILDAKRSLNINIFLKQFRSSYGEMIELILRGSSEDFGVERLRGLLKILPSSDEIEMLNSVPEVDKRKLASAENFLLQLIKLPGYKLRIEAMLLKEELESCAASIESSITAILQAAQDVKASEEFQEVIFMILVAGNFLNSGGYAGDAAGVKLASLQKITDIRGNKPGVSLLHFISMQAEGRNPRLISFVNDMSALEEASKTSSDQLQAEILSLNSKVTNICQQLTNPLTPKDVINQFQIFFKEAMVQIQSLETYLVQVEQTRKDLAQFFCEDLQTFRLEECFRILFTFTNKWKVAAQENTQRRKQEVEAEARRKAREEQLRRRSTQISWQNQTQVTEDLNHNKGIGLNPEDEIFIACSPRIVRRRLGSLSDNSGNNGNNNIQLPAPGPTDQLTLPSPDITPNGSLRRRRSRIPSEEDETGLMDFLRSSGSSDGLREKRGMEQYGSLDRSWSRKTRRRPNLMDFVNDERERPVSPAPAHPDHKAAGGATGSDASDPRVSIDSKTDGERKPKGESPVREWRERIAAWFVDLENGGSGEIPKRVRPPPQKFQRRLGMETRGESVSGGLATLPEGEADPEEEPPHHTTYQRVYPDRKPSLTVSTDVVSAMEAIEKVQSPVKEKFGWRRPSLTSPAATAGDKESPPQYPESGRRSLIESLGNQTKDEKLVLYIPEKAIAGTGAGKLLRRSPSMKEDGFKDGTQSPEAYGPAGTKEGFDRFSSIRRSRRYKKGPESPTSKKDLVPATPNTKPPTQKFVSKVDITGESTNGGTATGNGIEAKVVYTGSTESTRPRPFSRPLTRNDPRSSSMIEPRHVHLALGRKSSNEGSDTTGTKPLFAIPTPTGSTKGLLSSSPGSTERDEGFEESQSSLSETNSQTDHTALHGHGVLQKVSNNKPRLLRQDATTVTDGVSRGQIEKRLNLFPLTRKKSHQENSPTEPHVNGGSRTSLQGSRSSLTSQSTVNTVREFPDGKSKNSNGSVMSGNGIQVSALPVRKPLNVNNNRPPSTAVIVTTKNGKNDNLNGSAISSNPTKNSTEKGTKSLTPRLLSFMRPTASSSAKDKVEPPKPKGLVHKRSFK